jgi:hypothetical protein
MQKKALDLAKFRVFGADISQNCHLMTVFWHYLIMQTPREINPKMVAWYSKASYLLDIYEESDPYVAHLMAAVYLYATRLNYVSPDLEWLANAYVADMKMKIERHGDNTTWTPETRATLEAELRHAFFDSKAKADTLLGKGVVRPLFNPDKVK